MNLEFYVLNYNFNAKVVEMFTIFDNRLVYDGAITWDEFANKLDNVIK